MIGQAFYINRYGLYDIESLMSDFHQFSCSKWTGWKFVRARIDAAYSRMISAISNVWAAKMFRRMPPSKSGFLGRVGKAKKGAI